MSCIWKSSKAGITINYVAECDFSNFFSIGFDTLREINNDYIFSYYWNQERDSSIKNYGLNTFRSEKSPLDINLTGNKKANKSTGIKIIYDLDYCLGEPGWTDLIKAIIYAVQNPERIKKEQRRDTVRYNENGWYVSLLTIDTITINRAIGRQNQVFVEKDIQVNRENHYWIWGILALVIISFAGIKVMRNIR